MDWKQTMFKEHVTEFVEILDAKKVSINTDALRKLLGEREKISILDLGCGTGRLLTPLAELGGMVVGLDYSDRLLLEAMKKAVSIPNAILLKGDMKKLMDIFMPKQFDLVVRAYTSLGYFPKVAETKILKDCHNVSGDDAVLIVDTFNAAWFKINKVIERETNYETLTLRESYIWDETNYIVKCKWQYLTNNLPPVEIPFNLDVYDIVEMDSLLEKSGWKRKVLIDNLENFNSIQSTSSPERLIVVATKLHQT